MAANVYLRQIGDTSERWVRLADASLVCRATLVLRITGDVPLEPSSALRFAGQTEIILPYNVPITFDGVDLHDFEALIIRNDLLLVFAQSR